MRGLGALGLTLGIAHGALAGDFCDEQAPLRAARGGSCQQVFGSHLRPIDAVKPVLPVRDLAFEPGTYVDEFSLSISRIDIAALRAGKKLETTIAELAFLETKYTDSTRVLVLMVKPFGDRVMLMARWVETPAAIWSAWTPGMPMIELERWGTVLDEASQPGVPAREIHFSVGSDGVVLGVGDAVHRFVTGAGTWRPLRLRSGMLTNDDSARRLDWYGLPVWSQPTAIDSAE